MTDVLNERETTDDKIDTKPKQDTVTKDKEEIDETKSENEDEAENTETNASSVTSTESKQTSLEAKFAQAELALKKIKSDSKKIESDLDNNIEKDVDKVELANDADKMISKLVNDSKLDNLANNGAKVETVMSENASVRKHSDEGVPGLNVHDTNKTKTNIDTETPVAADNGHYESTTSKVEWSLNGTDMDLKVCGGD